MVRTKTAYTDKAIGKTKVVLMAQTSSTIFHPHCFWEKKNFPKQKFIKNKNPG